MSFNVRANTYYHFIHCNFIHRLALNSIDTESENRKAKGLSTFTLAHTILGFPITISKIIWVSFSSKLNSLYSTALITRLVKVL